jgi:hypothetical protein
VGFVDNLQDLVLNRLKKIGLFNYTNTGLVIHRYSHTDEAHIIIRINVKEFSENEINNTIDKLECDIKSSNLMQAEREKVQGILTALEEIANYNQGACDGLVAKSIIHYAQIELAKYKEKK